MVNNISIAFEDDFYSDCESRVEYNKKLNSAKINIVNGMIQLMT